MGRYEELSQLEKWAVNWHAQRVHDKQAAQTDGAGIFARQNAETHVKNIRESVASGPGVPELVQAFKRDALPKKAYG